MLCSTCGKSFDDASTFNKHQKTVHSAERTLKCETCGKSFYHSGHLKVHMRLHTGEKPYACSLCGKRYAYPDSIKKHMKFHLDKKDFTCTKCGRSFRWQESLKQHMKTHQKESISCDEAWLIQCREPVVLNDQRTHNALSIDVTDSDASLNQEISFLDSLAVKYF